VKFGENFWGGDVFLGILLRERGGQLKKSLKWRWPTRGGGKRQREERKKKIPLRRLVEHNIYLNPGDGFWPCGGK